MIVKYFGPFMVDRASDEKDQNGVVPFFIIILTKRGAFAFCTLTSSARTTMRFKNIITDKKIIILLVTCKDNLMMVYIIRIQAIDG